jgi:hypothetical protein
MIEISSHKNDACTRSKCAKGNIGVGERRGRYLVLQRI